MNVSWCNVLHSDEIWICLETWSSSLLINVNKLLSTGSVELHQWLPHSTGTQTNISGCFITLYLSLSLFLFVCLGLLPTVSPSGFTFPQALCPSSSLLPLSLSFLWDSHPLCKLFSLSPSSLFLCFNICQHFLSSTWVIPQKFNLWH